MPRISASATRCAVASSQSRIAGPRSAGAGTGWRRAAGARRRTRGWSAGARAPTYRPSLRSGRPDVSSPRTGNQPRHAGPAFAIAIACLASSSSCEELAGRGVDPAQQVGVDTVPGDAEEAERAAGGVDLGGHPIRRRRAVDKGATSITPAHGRWEPRRPRLLAYAPPATGVWLSWLERFHDTEEVPGSIPSTPTKSGSYC